MQNTQFDSLQLSKACISNLNSLHYTKMTEIQQKSLPTALQGHDIITQAQTGSGKTAVFALAIIAKIKIEIFQVQAMILCPTRELATQVANEIRKMARFIDDFKVVNLCGGSPITQQINSLKNGAHVAVGTPGRILDHLGRRSFKFTLLKTVVLDEADRMLDMGFADEINNIIKRLPLDRQTLLFSATFPDSIKQMSAKVQKQPTHIKTANSIKNTAINQMLYKTEPESKKNTLLALIAKYLPKSCIVFCTTRVQCNDIAKFLRDHDISALALHGELDQNQRDEIMIRFSNESSSILVATDVAARGLDFKELGAVINFELPKDPEIHVHRIGRTGRAGQKGLALSIYSKSEEYKLKAIEEFMNNDLKKDLRISPIITTKIKLYPRNITMKIFGGKKDKLRPGDILGALTQDVGVQAKYIGKINVLANNTYVGLDRSHIRSSKLNINSIKIKKRNFGLLFISS